VLCLPKLERLRWDSWICRYTPLSFNAVPSLKELNLVCMAMVDHHGFKLSKVLRDTTAVENLALNFLGEKVKPCSFCVHCYYNLYGAGVLHILYIIIYRLVFNINPRNTMADPYLHFV